MNLIEKTRGFDPSQYAKGNEYDLKFNPVLLGFTRNENGAYKKDDLVLINDHDDYWEILSSCDDSENFQIRYYGTLPNMFVGRLILCVLG